MFSTDLTEHAHGVGQRDRTKRVTRLAIACVAFAGAFGGVLGTIVTTWATNAGYSHGVLIPLISGYLIWRERAHLRQLPVRPDYRPGVALIAFGIALLVIGDLAMMVAVQALSVIVALTGLILVLFGRPILRAIWFPVAYLVVALPIWGPLVNALEPPSQVISGRIALVFLHAVGIPAVREGTLIHLPTVTLDILRACSGVSQLVVMTALVLPAGYVWLSGLARRMVLLAAGVCAAYLSNGFRIALVGFLSHHRLAPTNVEYVHLIEGLTVAVVGYVLVFACIAVLARWPRPRPTRQDTLQPRGTLARFGVNPVMDAVVLLLLVFGAVAPFGLRPVDVPLQAGLGLLPTQIHGWTLEAAPAPAAFSLMNADHEIVRVYRGPGGERVTLYVGYLRSQGAGRELTDDFTGQLFGNLSEISAMDGADAVTLGQVVRRERSHVSGAVFWYDINGRVVPNKYLAKIWTLWDGLTRRRMNGAVIVVGWDESSRTQALGFAQALLPILSKYLPS